MTVAEFIRWLETQDQGATVEVVEGIGATGYGGDSYRVAVFDPDHNSEYTDMRGNRFAIGTPREDSRTLLLGEAP